MSEIPPAVVIATDHPRRVGWIAGAVFGVALAAAVTAHLPDRAKLLGLVSLLWGAVVGAGLGWWARDCRVGAARWIWIVGWGVLAAGEAGIVLEAWRLYRIELQTQFAKEMDARFLDMAQPADGTKLTPEGQTARQQFETMATRIREHHRRALSLRGFLQRRLNRLGPPASPLPEVFWGGEILLGSLFGVWVMTRVIGPPSGSRQFEPTNNFRQPS